MGKPVLLFDFGGVLVDLDRQQCIDAFREMGIDISASLGTSHHTGIFKSFERGEIDVPAFCDGIRTMTGNANLGNLQIIHAWQQMLTGVPTERLDLLLRARQHYKTYILSNTNPIHWGQATQRFFRWGNYTTEDFFDGVFLSHELHCEKPEDLIFQKVINSIGVPAEDIVFLDDAEVNCEAARRNGMKALLAPANSLWFQYFDLDGKLLHEPT